MNQVPTTTPRFLWPRGSQGKMTTHTNTNYAHIKCRQRRPVYHWPRGRQGGMTTHTNANYAHVKCRLRRPVYLWPRGSQGIMTTHTDANYAIQGTITTNYEFSEKHAHRIRSTTAEASEAPPLRCLSKSSQNRWGPSSRAPSFLRRQATWTTPMQDQSLRRNPDSTGSPS